MSNARIERLTREALGPHYRRRRETDTRIDDNVLRAVGIVILVIMVVIFAAWPRGEHAADMHATAAPHASAGAMSVSQERYSPLY